MKVTSAIALTALLSAASAVELDVKDPASVKSAAGKIAASLVKSYPLNAANLHLLPDPYYWWETGLYLDTMIFYARTFKDRTIFSPAKITEVFQHQVGEDFNFLPINQSKSIGNDDQSYWALAAITGLENEIFEDSDKWIEAVESVHQQQSQRWESATCAGGLRWQIFTFNNGYDYKNSASNMNFFLLSARLAAYTNNSTYSDWASKVYDWSTEIGLISPDGEVFDGANAGDDCSSIDHIQWSANSATAAYGAAIMSQLDKDTAKWENRTETLVTHFIQTFTNSPAQEEAILVETACEEDANSDEEGRCNVDMKAFKGIAARYLGKIAQLGLFEPKLFEVNSKAVGESCNDEGACGFTWTDGKFDEDTGVGQQLNALSMLTALIVSQANGTENGEQTDVTKTAGSSVAKPTGTAAATEEAANGTSTLPASTAPATGAASSFAIVSAAWGIGALALGFAALL